jgi:FlaA1/EpsC-like NDP-sugar epimerase
MFDYKDKDVLITGGTGSIGNEIVRQLLEKPIRKLVIFSRDEIRQFVLNQELSDPRVEFVIGDVRDYLSLQSAFDRHDFDIVFHAAAMKHLVVCEDQPIECANTNIIGTNNVIRLCISKKVSRVVYLSTDKAACPTSVMGASKFIGERIALNGDRLAGPDQLFCCVRFGNVANSRGSVIPIMVDRMRKGKDIWISDENVTRFMMRISDAVRLVLQAAQITQGGEIFVLKMRSFKLGDLATVMEERIAPRLKARINLERRHTLIGEKMHEDLLNKVEFEHLLENDRLYIVLNNLLSGRTYPGFQASHISCYDSSTAQRLSDDELEAIIMEYVNKGQQN